MQFISHVKERRPILIKIMEKPAVRHRNGSRIDSPDKKDLGPSKESH